MIFKGSQRAKGAKPVRKCPECDATFMHHDNFKKHMIAIHSDAPRQFVCQWCGMGFKLVGNLRHHEKVSAAAKSAQGASVTGQL